MVKFYKESCERQDKQFFREVLVNKGGAGAPVAPPLAMPLPWPIYQMTKLMCDHNCVILQKARKVMVDFKFDALYR